MTPNDDERGVRDRILSAALTILREKGIQDLSQAEVAREADVRQSHLTYYFPKRRDLLEAVAARFVDGLAKRVQQASAKAVGDADVMLRQLAEVILEPGHMRMFLGIAVVADAHPDCRVILVRETLRMQAVVAEAIGGERAFERAGLILSGVWGLGLYGFVLGAAGDGPRSSTFLAALGRAAGTPPGSNSE